MKIRYSVLMATMLCACVVPKASGGDAEDPFRVPKEAQDQIERARIEKQKQRVLALKVLQESYADSREHFLEIQRKLQDQTGRTDVSAEGLQKTAARLDDELEALELESAGAAARREALAQGIEEMTKRAQELGAKDEAIKELMTIVDARARALERLNELAKAAAVSATELGQAKADLSEARIRLLDRQRDLSGVGGDSLTAWNRELLNLSVAAHEREARKAMIQKRLASIRDALAQIPNLQYEEDRMKAASRKLVDMEGGGPRP
ncbi:MAG TPA: hypothetical protein VKX17_06930 [Planctomycetota bacterium]|nr:hypothetical protein [Planctomycetota bacterium]